MSVGETVDARKLPIAGDNIPQVLDGVDDLYVARGKNIVHVNLADEKPTEESLKAMLVGPTGNLRAPALRRGKTLIVGFNNDMYQELFTG